MQECEVIKSFSGFFEGKSYSGSEGNKVMLPDKLAKRLKSEGLVTFAAKVQKKPRGRPRKSTKVK